MYLNKTNVHNHEYIITVGIEYTEISVKRITTI